MEVNSICIVGGGSSGWLMASALGKKLPKTEVTLVESPSIPIIGVGESTIPYFTAFLKNVLGFEEKEWMPYCDASFKAGIRFKDFSQKGANVWHPFWTEEEYSREGRDWIAKKKLTPELSIEDYYSSNYIAYHMCKTNKFSRLEPENLAYGHHMDAAKFAEFCRLRFKGTHILATVNSVESTGNTIDAIVTDKGRIQADMFIDCTGFKALLIGETLKEPYISFSDTLLNDTALTCRIPYTDRDQELASFTDCTALSSGWVWNTPLWSKIGTGYVYSSKFQTEESAELEFREYLTNRFGEERANSVTFNTVKYKTGMYERSWVGNCLALPLAGGFIEPLESTGLATIAQSISRFLDIIERGENSTVLRSMYNKDSQESFKEIHDFVLLHYLNSKREDSVYWRHIKNDLEIPESIISFLSTGKPLKGNNANPWFAPKSAECILLGMGTPSMYSINIIGDSKGNLLSTYTDEAKLYALKGLSYLDDRRATNISKANNIPKIEDYLKKEVYN